MKNKERIVTILISALVAVLFSSVSAYAAASYLYNADEVSYDKTNSELTSTDVQGAIDELYNKATEYTSLTNRVSALESSFGNTKPVYTVLKSGNLTNPTAVSTTTYTYTSVPNLSQYEAILITLRGGDAESSLMIINRSNNIQLKTVINSSGSSANPFIYSCMMRIHVDFDNNRIGYRVEKIGSGWTVSSSFGFSNVIGILKKV